MFRFTIRDLLMVVVGLVFNTRKLLHTSVPRKRYDEIAGLPTSIRR